MDMREVKQLHKHWTTVRKFKRLANQEPKINLTTGSRVEDVRLIFENNSVPFKK